MVRSAALIQAGAVDDPEPLKFFQVAVNRRQVHVRGVGANLSGEFLGTAVLPAGEQSLEEQAAGWGCATALFAYQAEYGLDSFMFAPRAGSAHRNIPGHRASIA